MKVLLVRHSTAVDPYEAPTDDTRWLTAAGRARMRRVAERVAGEAAPTRIFTSPLVRAVQTAEILAGVGGFEGPLEVHPPLAVEYGTTAQALAVLEKMPADAVVALVTHAPKVRVLAGHLSGQGHMPGFRTGSVCCVELGEAGGRFEWMLDPETLQLHRALATAGR